MSVMATASEETVPVEAELGVAENVSDSGRCLRKRTRGEGEAGAAEEAPPAKRSGARGGKAKAPKFSPHVHGFRFTAEERAELEGLFEETDGQTPDRATCEAIASRFSASPVRLPGFEGADECDPNGAKLASSAAPAPGATGHRVEAAPAVERLSASPSGAQAAHPVSAKQIKTWWENKRMSLKRWRNGEKPKRKRNRSPSSSDDRGHGVGRTPVDESAIDHLDALAAPIAWPVEFAAEDRLWACQASGVGRALDWVGPGGLWPASASMPASLAPPSSPAVAVAMHFAHLAPVAAVVATATSCPATPCDTMLRRYTSDTEVHARAACLKYTDGEAPLPVLEAGPSPDGFGADTPVVRLPPTQLFGNGCLPDLSVAAPSGLLTEPGPAALGAMAPAPTPMEVVPFEPFSSSPDGPVPCPRSSSDVSAEDDRDDDTVAVETLGIFSAAGLLRSASLQDMLVSRCVRPKEAERQGSLLVPAA